MMIEYRGAEGKIEQIPGLVNGTRATESRYSCLGYYTRDSHRKQATQTIPIVMVAGLDLVPMGLVDSLARPGGNITGISTLSQDLNGKRLELLKEAVPKLSRVGILLHVEAQSATVNLTEYETAARDLKVQLQPLEVRALKLDLESAFQTASKAHVGALITITNANLFLQQKRIAELAIKHRLPSMFEGSTWVESGGRCLTQATNLLHFAAPHTTWTES